MNKKEFVKRLNKIKETSKKEGSRGYTCVIMNAEHGYDEEKLGYNAVDLYKRLFKHEKDGHAWINGALGVNHDNYKIVIGVRMEILDIFKGICLDTEIYKEW